ncbi:MAG: hypothetical protein WEA36_10895 [Balneolaceae bacterium]
MAPLCPPGSFEEPEQEASIIQIGIETNTQLTIRLIINTLLSGNVWWGLPFTG